MYFKMLNSQDNIYINSVLDEFHIYNVVKENHFKTS